MANPNPDRARRLLVRTALITGSTVATVIGAQGLAMLDRQTAANITPGEAADNLVSAVSSGAAIQSGATPAQEIAGLTAQHNIVHAAPSIIILRQPGKTVAERSPNQQPIIQPPNPVQLAAPPPIIIQQVAVPAAPLTASSGSGGGNPSGQSAHSTSRSSR